jgi:hypothetical protein
MIFNILLAAVLTIIIETAFLFAVGYRNRLFVLACVLINFVTNIILNCTLLIIPVFLSRILVYLFEVVIVIIEWGVLSFFTQNKRKLLVCVLLSNLLSFSIGIIFNRLT